MTDPDEKKAILSLNRRQVLLTALGGALVASDYALAAPSDVAWPPSKFPIGLWCAPPEPFMTPAQYHHIAEAGFNVVMPPCGGTASIARNRKILDLCKSAGIKAILSDSRIPLSIEGNPQAQVGIRGVVSDYHKHPAFMGYFLTDEPGANKFSGLGEVTAAIHKLDPDHLVYVNLFPNYATTDTNGTASQLNTSSYDQYLDQFINKVKPDVLSYDNYPFLSESDRPGYFGNLGMVQRAANSTQPGTPFWQIILAVQHGPYRKLNENEIRFQAMQSLIYGAQGVVYFTYWLPDDPTYQWSNGIINRDGTDGPLYTSVVRVNQEVKALGKWLYGARVLNTFQTGDVPADGRPLTNDVPVSVAGSANLSIALFRDIQGYLYVMAANRDYKKPTETTLILDAGNHPIELFDLTTNKWSPVKEKRDDDGKTTIKISLGAAGVALTRWL